MLDNIISEIRKNPIWLIMMCIIIALVLVYAFYINGRKTEFDEAKETFLRDTLPNYLCSDHPDATYYQAGECPECQKPLIMKDPVADYKIKDKYICPVHKDEPAQEKPGNCQICGTVLVKEDPAKTYIDETTKYVEALNAEKAKIIENYKKGDEILERWFEDMKLANDGLPDLTYFQTRYKDEMNNLESRFIKARVQMESSMITGAAASSVLPKPDVNAFSKRENLKVFQKQFNVLEKVVNAMFVTKPDGTEDAIVTQFEKMAFETNKTDYEKLISNYWGKADKISQPGKPNFADGSLINFGVAVRIRYEDIPLLISSLLKVDDQYTPYLQVTGIKIRKLGNLPDNRTETISKEDLEGGKYRPSEYYLPAPVLVTITASVYDFNFETAQQ
ncbi:MAG: hypothetical protein HZA48_04075 [Planctomycetes bacterium]|nr:hypothetical protein [Planctomycetota bacterium]